MIKNCIICKIEFNPDHWRQKACSKICSKELKHLNRLKESDQVKKPKVQKTCKICNNDFLTRLPTKITCADKCRMINKRNSSNIRNKINRKIIRENRSPIIKNCIVCYNKFEVNKSGGVTVCSITCKDIQTKRRNKKWNDENPEKVLQYDIKRLTKLGLEFKLPSQKYAYALGSWTKVVRNTLGNLCLVCDSIIGLNIHHIFPKTKHPKLSLNPNNGIPLCKIHHKEIHDLNGWR